MSRFLRVEPEQTQVSVSWEIYQYILPAAQTGDETALLLLCKLANPEWADVQQADFTSEALGGGFSGNAIIKCTRAGKSGGLALKINPGSEGEDSLVNAAYHQLDNAGLVPKLYCLGNPLAPGLEVYDFVEGGTAAWLLSKHGPEFLANKEDATCFATLIAKLHSAPSEWYEAYKDHTKGQWEEYFVDAPTNKDAAAAKAMYGDYAFMTVLWGDFIAKGGKNGEALCAGLKELTPLLYGMLAPESLMGRKVVGHGDCHGCNLMHKTNGGHGDLCMIDLDFCGRLPAAIDLGTVLFTSMRGPLGYFFGAGEPQGEWPSLEQRRNVAQSYIDQLGDAAQPFTRNTVEEVMYDMEIGAALRALWLTPMMHALQFNNGPLYFSWQCLHNAKACLNLLARAQADSALKQRILEQGMQQIVTEGLLAQGCKPCAMSIEQFEKHWDLFGTLGPGFTGPFAKDDQAAVEEPTLDNLHDFQAATLRYYDSTGADVAALFNKFDLDQDGQIDLHELINMAVTCDIGFKTRADAENAMRAFDCDGDNQLTLDEFKAFLKAHR